MSRPLEVDSAVARAVFRLMRGDRIVTLPCSDGARPREQLVQVLDALLVNHPIAYMAFPVKDHLDALLLSGFLQDWLKAAGRRAERFADTLEVDLSISYTADQLGYFQSPVRIAFTDDARWQRLRDLHLVILDTAVTPDWKDWKWRRGAGYRAQLLLLGYSSVPEPTLPFTRTDRKRPWGAPTLEVILAAGG